MSRKSRKIYDPEPIATSGEEIIPDSNTVRGYIPEDKRKEVVASPRDTIYASAKRNAERGEASEPVIDPEGSNTIPMDLDAGSGSSDDGEDDADAQGPNAPPRHLGGEGSHFEPDGRIVYEDVHDDFMKTPGRVLQAENIQQNDAQYQPNLDQVDADVQTAKQQLQKLNRIRHDKLRNFVRDVAVFCKIPMDKAFNPGADKPRAWIEYEQVIGLEDVSASIYTHAKEAVAQIALKIDHFTNLTEEDIHTFVFSKNIKVESLFKRLIMVRYNITNYFSGAASAPQAKLNQAYEQEACIIMALSDYKLDSFSKDFVNVSDPERTQLGFPRTATGLKKPRVDWSKW